MFTTESQDRDCSCPPGISGNALIAAVDGEAGPETLAHLGVCPQCAARVERVRSLQRRLRYKLYRCQCPSTQVLIDYCQGLLEPQQAAFASHHIAVCPHCAAEVALLMHNDGEAERPAWSGISFHSPLRPLI
jgi:anti-sigma factor RsiW